MKEQNTDVQTALQAAMSEAVRPASEAMDLVKAATAIAAITGNVEKLEEQATRLKVTTDNELALATDFVKLVQLTKKKAEESRTTFTKPLNDLVKWFNGMFKPVTDRLDKVEMQAKRAMGTFMEEKRRAEEARLREIRRQEEEAALERAKLAETQGDKATAEATLQAAATLPSIAKVAPARGNFASANTSTRWTVAVTDPLLLVDTPYLTVSDACYEDAPVARTNIPVWVLDIEAVKSAIDAFVKSGAEGAPTIKGLRITRETSVVVR